MNPKLLAKLCAKGGSLEPSISSTSKSNITSSDVAAALSGLNKRAYLLMRIKWAGDSGQEIYSRLIEHVKKELQSYFDEWKASEEETNTLIVMALSEAVSPHKCPECEGRGVIHHKLGVVFDCDACKGRGLRSKTKTALAKQAGVAYTTWCRKWMSRYATISQHLDECESNALHQIQSKLQ